MDDKKQIRQATPKSCVLDAVMPTYTSHEVHRVPLEPTIVNVMAVTENLTWADVPGFHRLITLAGLGLHRFARTDQVLRLLLDGPYRIVYRSSVQLVIGGFFPMSRTFTYPDLGDDPVAGYRDVRVPRAVKVAANFLVADGCLMTETRNLPASPEMAEAFSVYWMAIRPFSGLIRQSWLAGIKRRVLAQPSAHQE